MNRLLVIGSVWPEPRSSAAGAHMLQVLRPFLDREWAVTFASTAADETYAASLSALGIRAEKIRVNDAQFDALLQEIKPDVVLFDRFFVEEQFGWRVEEHSPNALRILNCEDLHCLREARERAPTTGALTGRALNSPTARREIAAILRSDLSLLISEYEINFLVDRFGVDAALLHYAPFMIDVPDIREREVLPGFSDRQDFFTVGNFRHAPNWDSVRWLKTELWPMIRERQPTAKIEIAGAYASPGQMQLADADHGFLMAGRVDEVGSYFRSARLCLAPLRFGAGLKGKLIDAMVSGTPIVTTPIGAEGIAGELPWAGKIASDASALVSAACDLYEDETAWTNAQRNGFAILRARFDRHEHEPLLVEAVAEARAHLVARRDRNFMGAMLRDHHHRSTRYLSQWIEAKNRLLAYEESAETSVGDA